MKNPLINIALIISLTLPPTKLVHADIDEHLPQMGSIAGVTLSVNQEAIMGDYYLRELRSGAPLIYDPLLLGYLNNLGQRLAAKASSNGNMAFQFHLIYNDEINAFAFFGGHVVIHSALFKESDNEGQLASVIAHEIAHVTQRHLARSLEDQQSGAPIVWAGALGSILLALANPNMGMAAFTTTIAGSQQGMISFTQSNEQEADRIGIRILSQAGFNAFDMPMFMSKLSDKYRYTSTPPKMLLTHPLPDSRLADSRNRANQLPAYKTNSSLDYYLAKVRVSIMYSQHNDNAKNALYQMLQQGNARQKIAAQYAKALDAYKATNFSQAQQLLQPLLIQQPNNNWFIDLMTDIDLELKQPQQAINRLETALKQRPTNAILQINLANAYFQANQLEKANKVLNHYTFKHAEDSNGWDLLAQVATKQGIIDEAYAARAEIDALNGRLEKAQSLLAMASNEVALGSLKQARYDARIDQLRQLQQRFRQFVRH